MKTDADVENIDETIDGKLATTENHLLDDPAFLPLIDIDEFQTKSNGETKIESISQKTQDADDLVKATKQPRVLIRCKGIFYALISSLIFTVTTFVIKQLRVDFFDTLLCRFLVQTSILTAFIVQKRYRILHGSFHLVLIQIIRAICGSLGLLLIYASYLYIPLPDLTTIRYTQVIWTTLFAMIIFREQVSKLTVIAIILTLLGVICVAQPTFFFGHYSISYNETNFNQLEQRVFTGLIGKNFHRLFGFSLAFACAISISLSIVLNKQLLMLKIPPSVLIYQFSIVNLILLSIYHVYHRFILDAYAHQTMFTYQYLIAAIVSLFQLFSSTIIQTAFKLEHPSVISIVQSSDILSATLLQNILTNDKSNGLVLIGAALVTTSIFLVGLHKLWKTEENFSADKQPNRV